MPTNRLAARLGRAGKRGLTAALIATSASLLMAGTAMAAPSGAAFTTIQDAGTCSNGPGEINCNHYASKDLVYMSGGPDQAGLSDGDYFFAVLTPGSQNGGFADGADGNLSDTTAGATAGDLGSGDLVGNRTFTVADHQVTAYGGSHDTGTNPNGRFVIALAPFDDTDNAGGVYILAVCEVGATKSSQCKYDAFKVDGDEPPPPNPPAADLVVTKNANPAFDRSFTWTITKDVDQTHVDALYGTATFNYTVVVTKSAATDSNWAVTGTIEVFNPNDDPVLGVDVTDDINDANDSDTCVVTDGTGQTIDGLSSGTFDYACTYSAAPSPLTQTNTASATWPDQTLAGGSDLTGNTATFDVEFTFDNGDVGNPNLIDDCVTVTDANAPSGTFPASTCASASYPYSVSIPVPESGCVNTPNTASFVANTTGATGSDSETVTVCRVPPQTGAHTMGFWQNKNGQGIITAGAKTGTVCNSGTWLRGFAPFGDLSATATCAQVATYVLNVIKAATCTSTSKTCNSMLKGQMLATALSVYFSDPALGGDALGAPAPIGGVKIDLTKVCTNIAACAAFENVSSAFGGAASLTVSQMLAYAASKSNSGGSTWYGNVKATQVLAKDAFDAINNQVAFAAP
jgi:hypothetical protein